MGERGPNYHKSLKNILGADNAPVYRKQWGPRASGADRPESVGMEIQFQVTLNNPPPDAPPGAGVVAEHPSAESPYGRMDSHSPGGSGYDYSQALLQLKTEQFSPMRESAEWSPPHSYSPEYNASPEPPYPGQDALGLETGGMHAAAPPQFYGGGAHLQQQQAPFPMWAPTGQVPWEDRITAGAGASANEFLDASMLDPLAMSSSFNGMPPFVFPVVDPLQQPFRGSSASASPGYSQAPSTSPEYSSGASPAYSSGSSPMYPSGPSLPGPSAYPQYSDPREAQARAQRQRYSNPPNWGPYNG
ncbi:uncharacterized protein BXZ73DRAFT_104323 [Epithele typhae]|uniref:uncharacterized protein n=1 Tax=Epithele typhae TaxID=378194 RepID=UPI002007DF5C|nr:uncharacterized protein BXZ73DRAFT_104323 [Epithele typhae]KAH9921702.1 hypothetical protein BXZ73DRAFT_104323 [Epithele typhae]